MRHRSSSSVTHLPMISVQEPITWLQFLRKWVPSWAKCVLEAFGAQDCTASLSRLRALL